MFEDSTLEELEAKEKEEQEALKAKWRNEVWYIPPNRFEKWHACGNDFVLMCEPVEGYKPRRVCDRHYGVGADGLIYLLPSTQADVRMQIFNADGSEAEMCGNGIRCLGQYMSRKLNRNTLTVETAAGIKELLTDGLDVRVNMGAVTPHWNNLINLPGREYDAFHLEIGNPHCVLLVTNGTEEGEVEKYGPMIESNAAAFPEGVNVEWLEIKGRKRVFVKVWERGCGHTLGCGTGACAAAVVAYDRGHIDDIVTVELEGGEVEIDLRNLPYGDVFLTGMAHYLYRGELYPPEY